MCPWSVFKNMGKHSIHTYVIWFPDPQRTQLGPQQYYTLLLTVTPHSRSISASNEIFNTMYMNIFPAWKQTWPWVYIQFVWSLNSPVKHEIKCTAQYEGKYCVYYLSMPLCIEYWSLNTGYISQIPVANCYFEQYLNYLLFFLVYTTAFGSCRRHQKLTVTAVSFYSVGEYHLLDEIFISNKCKVDHFISIWCKVYPSPFTVDQSLSAKQPTTSHTSWTTVELLYTRRSPTGLLCCEVWVPQTRTGRDLPIGMVVLRNVSINVSELWMCVSKSDRWGMGN